MKYLNIKVKTVQVLKPYQLRIRFEDGLEKDIDFSPLLRGKIYGPLRDQQLFQEVRLDPDSATIAWPNDADLDPESLYNWKKYVDELKEKSQGWDK